MADEEARLSLAQLVKLARGAAGVGQKEAAARVGVHYRTWQNWERGLGLAVNRKEDIEDALGLGRGWFREHEDPLGHVFQMAKDIADIKDELKAIRKLLK